MLRRLILSAVVVGLLLAASLTWEAKTSAVQSRVASSYAARLQYAVGAGRSPSLVFPNHGPFDEIRGYVMLPTFTERLATRGFTIAKQVRMNDDLVALTRAGVPPPYREPAPVGLVLRDWAGRTLFDATPRGYRFATYAEIPRLAVLSLLFIENRELADHDHPYRNPAVEWDRLGRAVVLYAGSKLGLDWRVEGGSTLAVQIEKFRHSVAGRTDSGGEKVRQIVAASLKAYREGRDTTERRREIVLDYLNSMPLGAAPGYGELYGLGEGLYAWFGLDQREVVAALDGDDPRAKAHAFKHVLALIAAVRAPSVLLGKNRAALEERVSSYLDLLVAAGVVDAELATTTRAVDLIQLDRAPQPPPQAYVRRKGVNLVRTQLMELLGVPSLYTLDRLHMEVDTTLDLELQERTSELLDQLVDPAFVTAAKLREERVLGVGDPTRIVYSVLLVESLPDGNVVRVHTDSLNQPFDLNQGMKLELGSTGKLRTLAHYLEVVALLLDDLAGLPAEELATRRAEADDELTRWAAATLLASPDLPVDGLLDRALERRYSASADEVFFTGSGEHHFQNFEREDDRLVLSVREATWRSTNLVFIRLMRDLVRYHVARLPYPARAVLADPDHPQRRALLAEEGDAEAQASLLKAFRELRGEEPEALERRLVGRNERSTKRLAMVFFAWNPGADQAALATWLGARVPDLDEREVGRLFRAYGRPELTLADHAYLLQRNPLEVWCAGVLAHQPAARWKDVLEQSEAARRQSTAWLFSTRNRRAQDLRLRIRIEKDAFARMTPAWQRLGFPFDTLVPSLATAVGASGDRPMGLADLMGILVTRGMRRPTTVIEELTIGLDTPYFTHLVEAPARGERVPPEAVAAAMLDVLTGVVATGTAHRLAGSFQLADGTVVPVGGKTGSGDNRFKTFDRDGGVTSSRAVNRTASFAFFVGDRFFGVITAFVDGDEAGRYRFTSALPVSVLKLLAPDINARLAVAQPPSAAAVGATPTTPVEVTDAQGEAVAPPPPERSTL